MYILFIILDFLYRRSLDYYTNKKENIIFLIYKEIQMGSGAKSFMRKGFLVYEEISKYFTIYGEAVLHPIPPNFLIYEENFIFFFISVIQFSSDD
jgi:hypothetical protein